MKQIINKIASINERYGAWLFYAALMLVSLSTYYFSIDDCSEWIKTLSMKTGKLAMWLCMLRILLLTPRDPWYTASCCIGIILVNISCHFASSSLLYNTTVLILASRDTNIRITLRILLCVFLALSITAFTLHFFDLAGDITKHKFGLKGHSWGFCNPNFLAFILTISVMGILTFYNEVRAKVLWPVCVLSALIILLMTLGVTSVLILILFPLFCLTLSKLQPSAKITVFLPIIGLVISTLLAAIFGPSWGKTTFDCRFSIPALVWRDWGLSLMGQNCITPLTPGWETRTDLIILDNIFLHLPLHFGFIPALIGYAVWSLSFWQMARRGQWQLLSMAICVMICGFMERVPMIAILNPTLFYITSAKNANIHLWRKLFYGSCGLLFIFVIGLYNPLLTIEQKSDQEIISSIKPLEGFDRMERNDGFVAYIRNLPLADADESIHFFDGTKADSIAKFCYRIIDVPLLSESEQCADVCLHLRADYLYRNHRFFDIHFEDTQHNIMRHKWFGLRKPFEDYLQYVFGWANTESMKNEMPTRSLDDVQVGDVWVYDAKSRPEAKYGHAIMVADVAKNPVTGETAVLLLQGSTPACSIHLLNNTVNPELSPWFILDQKADTLDFGMAKYQRKELYSFKD